MNEQVNEQDSTKQDGRADFDFFIGQWKSRQRRLIGWLKGSREWEEFEGTHVVRKVLGGLGNMDEVVLARASGPVLGMTVRFFDPQSQQWSIYWADSVHGFQLPATIGGFKDGRGEFYDHEPFEGKHIFCRFIWSEITPTSCRWEQAFSADGGRTWETNWMADFVRSE